MKQFYANGRSMSQILGSEEPEIGEKTESERAEDLYQKRLLRLRQWAEGRDKGVLSTRRCFDWACTERSRSTQHDMQDTWIAVANEQLPNRVRHCVRPSADDDKITYTSFIPYITSVSKQCLQPIMTIGRIVTLLIFVSLCLLNSAQAQSRSLREGGGTAGGPKEMKQVEYERYRDSEKRQYPFGKADSTEQHQLLGFVGIKYEGQPLEGAKVSYMPDSIYVFTDTNGKFELPVRSGFGVMEITKTGFAKARIPIENGIIQRTRNRFSLSAVHDGAKVLHIGDTIPDQLWDLPIRIVNHRGGRTVVSLREFSHHKLIVLDFWAKWCAPCVRSVEKWEKYKIVYGHDLALLPVQMDMEDRAVPFITDRGWTSPVVVGKEVSIVNSFFFPSEQLSRAVWIVDGKLFAITGTEGSYGVILSDLLAGPRTDNSHRPAARHGLSAKQKI